MKFVNQRHPLLLHPGVNQRKREVVELSPTYAQVDDRDLADLLNWFYGYSKQVNFHEYIKESEAVEYIALSDWSSFFEQSIPFLLARIAKTDIASLALAMQKMEDGVRSNPASGSLLPIFDFVYYELFLPFQKWALALDAWQAEVLQSAGNALNEIPPDFTFRARLNAIVKGNLRQQFLNFMALSNGAHKWHGTGAFPFTTFVGQSGWDVQLIDTLSTNEAFLNAPGGAQGQFLQILDELSAIVQPVLAAFKRLVGEAPAHIKDSLEPLHAYWQERHAPHLGLLFTFLELFGRSQNDLNGLTKAHLDFFFQNVLRIKPRPEQPDEAHLVLEISKHLDRYLVKEGTLFKDGKDANNIDLRYRLGNEVLIDKAKVAALSTLFMNKQMAVLEPGQAPSPVIEGLYIAPVANSADGKGEPFADPATATWATLGAKESKFFPPNATEAQDHQVGRLGFVLASPVLWLQEGRRRIRVGLTCDISANTDISSSYFEAVVEQFKESGLLTYFKYCLTDNIVNKLENLCPSSKAYLQALLSEKNPYTIIGDLAEWIDSATNPITCAKIFQPIEANQLFVALSDSLNKQRYLKKIHLLCAKSVLPTSSDELVFLTDLVESNSGAFKLESTFANDPNILAPIQKDLKALDIVERAFISDDLAQRIEAFFRLDNIENSPQFIYHLRPIHLNPDGPHATGNPLLLPENVRLNEYFGSLLEGRNSFPIGVNIGFWLSQIQYPNGNTFKLSNPIINVLENCIKKEVVSVFNVSFSGEKEWVRSKPESTISVVDFNSTGTKLTLTVEVDLGADEPAVSFFNEEVLKEKFQLKKNLPIVKIEINEDAKIYLPKSTTNSDDPDKCCLVKDVEVRNEVSLYHFLRGIKILDTRIDVEVCGVKNLVLQNDESLQDSKGIIYPFGLRPNVPDFNVRNLSLVQSIEELEANGANLYGPSFYVGSKEVFYKNWQKVWLNFNWKGKPSDFEEHYKAYVRRGVTPNYAYGLSENDFTVKVSVIENNAWRAWDYPADNDACFPEDNQKFRELFCPKIPNPFDALANICLPKDPEVQIMEFSSPARRGFVDFDKPLEVFQTATHGFIRLTLYGQDFLHKDYAYVLARQMMATGLLSQGTILDEAFYIDGEGNIVTTDIDLTEFVTERDQAIAAWTTFETHMNTTFTTAVGQANTDFAAASAQAISDASDAAAAAQALDTSIDGANPNDLLDRVTDVRTKALNASNAAIGITKLDEAKERSTQLAMMNVLNRCIQLRDFVTLKLEPFVLSAPSTSISALQVLVSPDPDSLLDFADKALTAANLAAGEADLLSGDDGGSILSVANSIDAAVTAIQDVFNFIDLAGGLKDDVNAAASITPAIIADISGPLKTKAVAALNAATLALTSAILINGPTNASILNVETSTDSTRLAAIALFNYVNATVIPLANTAVLIANNANTSISDLIDDRLADLLAAVNAAKNDALTNTITGLAFAKTQTQEVFNLIGDLNIGEAKAALIPNEPWTPAIKEFSIDYTATAEIEDIELIHLYPFEATSKPEDLRQEPTLLPTFTDEGTLFIGLHDLKPYSNLCLLMQLAEATADSELDRVKLRWSYLSGNNAWRPLRPGFELLEDGTKDLTVSGIVKIAVPGDIAPTGYSIMPTGYTWIKVAMPEADPNAEGCVVPIASRVKAVAEAVGMHAQAAKVTFHPVPLNDLQRLANSLPAGSISKLEEADFSIKKVQQPYQSFGGKLPEAAGNLYTRVSEHLRHKGRAIAPFDLERLVLDAFPEVYKAKAIGHTFGLTARGYVRDLEVAPGFVTLAVIPDLTKLRAGERSEPRCPVSLLEEIRAFLRKRMSAFARLKVMNPRYEKIDVSITVRLIKGKVQDYHASKLKEDIRLFLAPWYLGDLDKMTFGQPVTWSDMVKYVENLDYVDFIDDLKLVQVDKMPCEAHEQPIGEATHEDPCSSTAVASQVIYPLTARSILTGGEICVNISPAACDEYAEENACENTARPFGRNNKRNLIS